MRESINITIRYSTILLITFLFLSNLFLTVITKILVNLTAFFFNIFINTTFKGNEIIVASSYSFFIVESCIAIAAYILITFILFSMKNEIRNIFKVFSIAIILFTLFNLLRIWILIIIFITLGEKIFNTYHLLFYEFLSGVVVALLLIILIKYYNLKGIPVIDDIKIIMKKGGL